jgi:hypothetical protein
MTQKLILVVYFGLLIAFSNGTNTFYAKFDKTTPKPKPTNFVIPRMNTGHPFNFPKLFSRDPPETALCPAKLPIVCSYNNAFICVEHDKTVFNSLNNVDATQTINLSNSNYQFTCGLARQKTDLTLEEFEKNGILHQFIMETMIVKLEDIEGDPIAICRVSNSNQVQYFQYNDDDAACKYMAKFKSKKFHINNKPYFLSCHKKTNERTAKEVIESAEDFFKLKALEKWFKKYKYHLGLTLLFCIIVVTVSLCCCTITNDDTDNEDPNNHYPVSSDFVLEVMTTDSSLITIRSNDLIPSSTCTTESSTVEENTQSNSVEPEADTQSQKESFDLEENIQPQSNSVDIKENTQSKTKSVILENTQS